MVSTSIGKICDCCGKESRNEMEHNTWFHVNAHHSEWGNDSIDSYEWYDICSSQCYIDKMIAIFLKMRYWKNYSAEIFGLDYRVIDKIIYIFEQLQDKK